MKHLLSAIAVAGLIGAVPAWAQTSSSDQTTKPVPQASASDKAEAQAGTSMGKTRHGASHAARGQRSPEDNMAEELNRQELEHVQAGGAAAGTGTSGTTMPAPGGASGSSLPSTGAPRGYQPSNPSTKATGAEIGRPSQGTMEEHPGAAPQQ